MENADLTKNIGDSLGEKIVDIKLIGQGCGNNAYLVQTDDDKKYLVKSEREQPEEKDQNDLLVEAELINYLNEADETLPIPHVVAISKNPKYFVYNYIDGDLMIHSWHNLEEKNRIALCEAIGEFHARLGKCSERDKALELNLHMRDKARLTSREEGFYRDFLSNTSLPDELKEQAKRAKEMFDDTSELASYQLIHNDVHNENILISNNELAGIIDFGDSEYGDVHKDFHFHARRHPDNIEHFVNGYEKASDNKLSLKRIVSYAMLKDLPEIADYYHNRDKEIRERTQTEYSFPVRKRAENYGTLLKKFY